jgi:uncharacterized membrane protein
MTDLIYFILCAFGATQVIVYSSLTPKWNRHTSLGKFLGCPMCVGFHVGWILLLVPNTLFQFEVNIINAFLLGFISSGTSYLLCEVMGDDGIRLDP